MNVVVFTPCLIRGDAVSNDAVGMVEALQRAGYRAHLASRWARDGLTSIPVEALPNILVDPRDVLIYHHSIGLEDGVRIFEYLDCRKIIKYHNITPPHYFHGISKDLKRGCELGIAQVDRLLTGSPAVWVDSDFNGKDLQRTHPAQTYRVLPPFNQVRSLLESDLDPTAVALHDDWKTNVLMVGRIVPNKNLTLAVDAFAEYRTRFDAHARLILVGDVAQNKYCDRVIERIREHNLSRHVSITGKVSLPQLKSLYLTAQVLLTTSSHEGFCLPLVEAMGMHVPIVAVPNAAIPDTAGDAAWYAEENPRSIAEKLEEVRSSPEAREDRLLKGSDRYAAQFTNDAIENLFLGMFRACAPEAARESEVSQIATFSQCQESPS